MRNAFDDSWKPRTLGHASLLYNAQGMGVAMRLASGNDLPLWCTTLVLIWIDFHWQRSERKVQFRRAPAEVRDPDSESSIDFFRGNWVPGQNRVAAFKTRFQVDMQTVKHSGNVNDAT